MSGSWASALGQLIPLALVVAMSPVTIIPAIVLVLQSDRARSTGLAFMSGWLFGLAATTAVFVQVPRLVDGLNRPAPAWAAWVRIGAGVLLLALGVWRWLTRRQVAKQPDWLSRLGRLSPVGACAIAVGLILVNPKVLLMNAAAGLVIGTHRSAGRGHGWRSRITPLSRGRRSSSRYSATRSPGSASTTSSSG
jgi:hypothetical protein